MAFASGSVSFRRFQISGPAPADVTDAFIEALNDNSFGKYSSVVADGTEMGWISGRHLFETNITAEQVAYGRFAHFALRIDRNAVPSGVLRSYMQMEEDAALKASGRAYLSKKEKQQAREAAQARADREVKNGAFRRIAAHPVLLDLDRQTVFFGHVGDALGDKLGSMFIDTFGCSLEAADAGRSAYRIMQAAGDSRSVEDARPFHLVREPDGGEAGDCTPGDASFLGKEFLTWLWWKTDSEEPGLRLSTGDEVSVMIDRVMRMECDFAQTGTTVITAVGPASLPEAKAALGGGKQPTRMGLIFGSRAGEFNLTLEGARFAVTGLVLPKDEEKREPRALLEKRFEQIADAAELLNVLYELFLRRRTAHDWSRELGAMRAWASPATTPLVRAASA